MHRRIGLILLILFQCGWLLAVLPGHTRGLISWVKPELQTSVHDCCAPQAQASKTHEPTPEQKKQCAICYFAVGLTPPPPMAVDVPALSLSAVRPLLVLPEIAEQQHYLTYYACGPPGC